jgi:predicted ArsR family transcriptional regulator
MDKPLLDSAVRRGIVERLSTEDGLAMTASELAAVVGVHTSTARFHLDQLVAGQALGTRYERRGVGRPRKVYFVTEKAPVSGVEQHNHALQLLSGLLVDMLAPHGNGTTLTPEQAGERWARENIDAYAKHDPATTPGEWLSKIGGLTDVLHEWGYEPAVSTGTNRDKVDVRLTHCPFRDMARANPTVVCGIHRGLMRGAMAELGELTTDVELLPFVEGDTCVAHLQRHAPSADPPTTANIRRRGAPAGPERILDAGSQSTPEPRYRSKGANR